MMLTLLQGDLFQSDAQTLVNTVNCVGVMGKGVALEFKRRFPEMYEDYLLRCKMRSVRLGQPYLFRRLSPPWIINFPTKDHWRAVSKLSDIIAGLEYLDRHYAEWGITSLAVPPLGCGQGGLEWRVVGPVLARHLQRLDIPVILYAPLGTPQVEMDLARLTRESSNTPGLWAVGSQSKLNPTLIALVSVLDRVESQRYHWPVGRVAFQKIAYFATQAGLPTQLQHTRDSYGPFAPGLKRVQSQLVNNGLIEERSAGRMILMRPGATYKDAAKAYQDQVQPLDAAVERTADLILRIQTKDWRALELAATAHFAAQELQNSTGTTPSEADIITAVQHWKQRRRPPFSDDEIARAIETLYVLGWLDVELPADVLDLSDDLIEA
jgi:O-acetyl-ADP-ribose deacetylase (regulator of RNase III)/uncharacterized protein YwgA